MSRTRHLVLRDDGDPIRASAISPTKATRLKGTRDVYYRQGMLDDIIQVEVAWQPPFALPAASGMYPGLIHLGATQRTVVRNAEGISSRVRRTPSKELRTVRRMYRTFGIANWVVQGQGLVRVCALVQAAIGCRILLLLVPKTVLTLCDLHWWFVLSSISLAQISHLHLLCTVSPTCTDGAFLVPTSALSKVHT